MKTGIVVSNFDPKCKNRCQIRVFGIHTETINGQYIIVDDDLPWASPAPNVNSSAGNYCLPRVGDRVYVDVIDTYNIVYYGQVEVKSSVKDMIHDNADANESLKVIAFSEESDSEGGKDYVKIYYLPENGLTIECNGNHIKLTKYDGIEVKTKNDVKISVTPNDNNITISTSGNVNLNCDKVNLTENASEKIVLGSKLFEKFNNHTHYTPRGLSSEPIQQLEPSDFSDKVRFN